MKHSDAVAAHTILEYIHTEYLFLDGITMCISNRQHFWLILIDLATTIPRYSNLLKSALLYLPTYHFAEINKLNTPSSYLPNLNLS